MEDAVPTHYNYDFRNGNVYSGADEYAYDANGNMIRDDNKGITVTYNELNLPTEVDFGNDNRIEWVYSASGDKLKSWKISSRLQTGMFASFAGMRKTVYFSDGISVVKDYIGSFVYVDGVLDFFHTSEGRVEYDGTNFEYQYSIKDHLGNVRVLFADDGAGNAIIKQENHYYPYGLTLAGLGSTGGSDNKFLYNGKELEDEHNLYWYHYGARYYDPQLGIWHSIDPADEFYSPYVYVGNNPVNFLDPDGQKIEISQSVLENEELYEAGKRWAATPEGRAQLALFAEAGKEYFGQKFDKNGIYVNNTLKFKHDPEEWYDYTRPTSINTVTGEVYEGKFVTGEAMIYEFEINLLQYTNEFGMFDMGDNYFHEVEHAILYSELFQGSHHKRMRKEFFGDYHSFIKNFVKLGVGSRWDPDNYKNLPEYLYMLKRAWKGVGGNLK